MQACVCERKYEHVLPPTRYLYLAAWQPEKKKNQFICNNHLISPKFVKVLGLRIHIDFLNTILVFIPRN